MAFRNKVPGHPGREKSKKFSKLKKKEVLPSQCCLVVECPHMKQEVTWFNSWLGPHA